MGIPHLISTLEPYAVHGVLDNDRVVIDGPALAYHILHICNRHGIVQPSYQLLGDTTIAWLDELVSRGVSVEAIYFDGHLPRAKRLVRMERMVKSLNQLKASHSKDPSGFSPAYFSTAKETPPTLFSSTQHLGKPILPPSFHVPAIIDALRLCNRYAKFVHLVPGEADAYCAQRLSKSGGTVLTSDSDLLVHDLGHGRVVFLRDIYLDGQSRLACASFSPAHICEKVKLSPASEICRLAYERKRSPHSTLPQLLRDCAQGVADTAGYAEFCHEYLDHETAPLPVSTASRDIRIGTLDPRISELILQLGNQDVQPNDPNGDMIFLPILLENPSRGSAWEQSTPIRQLAYTVARRIIPGPSSIVQEYRRVNTSVQKGRQVHMLPKEAAKVWAQDLTNLMSEANVESGGDAVQAWHMLCLTLDIRHCCEEGKKSHVLQILEECLQQTAFKRVSWDIIHFVAQLQAAHYSFRLLKQAISLASVEETMPELHSMLSSLPSLAEFPTIESTLEFLRKSGDAQILKTITRLVPLPNTDPEEQPRRTSTPKKRKAVKQHGRGKKAGPGNTATRNPFDILSHDT
ncbi:XPG-I-2 domain-containing protein [Fusarium keratoplasticum]|nr:XPG-I-2 domain-containing protein [Fusarium keratoplasticum]